MRYNHLIRWTPLIITLAILSIDALDDILSPVFYGDAGHRINCAYQLNVRLGNRIYLPFLQAHILLGYLLHAPLVFFKLIPLAYSFLFLYFLHKIYAKITSGTAGDRIFEVALLMGMAFHPLVNSLATQLYQEVPSIALLYAWIYLYYFHRQRYISLAVVGLCALYCREHIWILFGVFGLLAVLRRRVSLRNPLTYIYSIWGASLLVWIIRTRQTAGLRVNVEDNLVTAEVLAGRAANLLHTIGRAELWPLLGAAAVTAAALWIYRDPSDRKAVSPFPGYMTLSLTSIALTYGYVIVADPWQYTPNSTRALFPLMLHIPVWIILLYQRSKSFPVLGQRSASLFLAGGLVMAAGAPELPDPAKLGEFHYERELASCVNEYRKTRGVETRLLIGLAGIDYWDYGDYLAGPMLYEKTEDGIEQYREGAQIVFATPHAPLPDYELCASLALPTGQIVNVMMRKPEASELRPNQRQR